jgi:rRNA processing protein Krr1/Pno1
MTERRDTELERVIEQTGATYRQLDHWCRQNYLLPGTPGVGSRRQWPPCEVMVARRMVRLTAAGIPPKVAVRVARAAGRLEIGPGVYVIMASPGMPDIRVSITQEGAKL